MKLRGKTVEIPAKNVRLNRLMGRLGCTVHGNIASTHSMLCGRDIELGHDYRMGVRRAHLEARVCKRWNEWMRGWSDWINTWSTNIPISATTKSIIMRTCPIVPRHLRKKRPRYGGGQPYKLYEVNHNQAHKHHVVRSIPCRFTYRAYSCLRNGLRLHNRAIPSL
ncbi:hypothetical protein PsorP6_001633 [Peronosclerospora sorghi]|uniref:Uncharacterized protein n=1 Tax=Peronosclerospora sorghi TaxID=230839 RepID=A0ACC0WRJ7_9STRA|nr:hypothetical protein PsorP6_001633 [Peronosclerospora sorghi]